MQLVLSREDHDLVIKLRRLGVLEKIESHRLSGHTGNGTVLVMCSDGDHFKDIFEHHCQNTQCGRHHTVATAGGVIVGLVSEDGNFDLELHTARTFKGISSVALTAHVPCAAATRKTLSILQILSILHEKKVRAKLNNFNVHSFLHVTYNNNRKRTYFVNWPKWREHQAAII